MKLSKTLKVAFIEIGMLGGIVLAGYTLPASTPLKAFAIASVAALVLGNILIIRQFRRQPNGKGEPRGAWPHILRGFAILAVGWLLILFFHIIDRGRGR